MILFCFVLLLTATGFVLLFNSYLNKAPLNNATTNRFLSLHHVSLTLTLLHTLPPPPDTHTHTLPLSHSISFSQYAIKCTNTGAKRPILLPAQRAPKKCDFCWLNHSCTHSLSLPFSCRETRNRHDDFRFAPPASKAYRIYIATCNYFFFFYPGVDPLFADTIPRVTYFPSRWVCYFILTMNTPPFDSFLCFCFHILILLWVFWLFFCWGRGGGGKGGFGWRRGGCRKGVHLASLHSRKHFFLQVSVSFQQCVFLHNDQRHWKHRGRTHPTITWFRQKQSNMAEWVSTSALQFWFVVFQGVGGWEGLGGGGSIRSWQPVT